MFLAGRRGSVTVSDAVVRVQMGGRTDIIENVTERMDTRKQRKNTDRGVGQPWFAHFALVCFAGAFVCRIVQQKTAP